MGMVAMAWYRGDSVLRTSFPSDWKWDRDRTTRSLNEEGPGIYFTSDYEQAASYGPRVVETDLPKRFRVMPMKPPTLKALREIYAQAEPEDREVFLSNWGESVKRDDVLRKYARQNTLHDALVSLYSDLFRHDAERWIMAVRSLGFDGVIVEKSYGKKHLIVWDPNKLSTLRESEPPREGNPRGERPSWMPVMLELFHGTRYNFRKHVGQWWSIEEKPARAFAGTRGDVRTAVLNTEGLRVLDVGAYEHDTDTHPGDGAVRKFRGYDIIVGEDEDEYGRPHTAIRIVSGKALKKLVVDRKVMKVARSTNTRAIVSRLKKARG